MGNLKRTEAGVGPAGPAAAWSRWGRRGVVGALAILGATMVLHDAGTADAVTLHAGCGRSSAKIWWRSEWPSHLKPTAQAGANYWETFVRHWSGHRGAVDVRHDGTSSNRTIEARWQYYPDSTIWGEGNCSAGWFAINSRKQAEWEADAFTFKSAVAHELGHAIGLDHVGKQDSFDARIPIMATCRGATAIWQDDAAGANALGNRTGSFYNLTANSSFENGSSYWGRSGGSFVARSPGGVDGSLRYVEFRRQASTAYMFSTTRISDNQGQTLDWLQGRANYKKNDGRDTGYVTVVLRVGRYNYPSGETCGAPDFYGHNGVERVINAGSRATSWYVWLEKNCTPGNGWGYCTASGTNPSSADVFDARVYVYNRMSRPGVGWAPVDIDRTRVMADF